MLQRQTGPAGAGHRDNALLGAGWDRELYSRGACSIIRVGFGRSAGTAMLGMVVTDDRDGKSTCSSRSPGFRVEALVVSGVGSLERQRRR